LHVPQQSCPRAQAGTSSPLWRGQAGAPWPGQKQGEGPPPRPRTHNINGKRTSRRTAIPRAPISHLTPHFDFVNFSGQFSRWKRRISPALPPASAPCGAWRSPSCSKSLVRAPRHLHLGRIPGIKPSLRFSLRRFHRLAPARKAVLPSRAERCPRGRQGSRSLPPP